MNKEELTKLFEATTDIEIAINDKSTILFLFDRLSELYAECDDLKIRIEKLENKGERDE